MGCSSFNCKTVFLLKLFSFQLQGQNHSRVDEWGFQQKCLLNGGRWGRSASGIFPTPRCFNYGNSMTVPNTFHERWSKAILSHLHFYLYEENLFRFQRRSEIYYVVASKLPTRTPDGKSYFTKNEALKFYCHKVPVPGCILTFLPSLPRGKGTLNFPDPIVSNTSSTWSTPCLASSWQSCLKFKKFSPGKILQTWHMPSLTTGARHRPPHPHLRRGCLFLKEMNELSGALVFPSYPNSCLPLRALFFHVVLRVLEYTGVPWIYQEPHKYFIN